MGILNLLTTSQEFIPFSVSGIDSGSYNFLVKAIKWLFETFSNVYGGVILGVLIFTLVLKTIVLPLDIYSRVKTKKQSLLMEQMRPQMEKLQKQYANDKNMYSQKVMELQKQNGYNPLGACLPMVISLVIFMVVFSAFSTYSNYAVLNNYNDMVVKYNESVNEYVIESETDTKDGFLLAEGGNYRVVYEKFEEYYQKVNGSAPFTAAMKEADKNEIVAAFVKINARRASAAYYRNETTSTRFLWIGNVWYPDSMLNKEVPDFSKFSSSVARVSGSMGSIDEAQYNEVTYYLRNADPANPDIKLEGNTFNGYFVMVVLSIGLMFLQQFVMMRSQKAASELSSVDGSAAKTNKWMTIMMPLIFGVFSFFYSAAFSTYMIINTTYSLLSTLIINKIVAVRFAKTGIVQKNKGNKRPINRKRLK
ncbi:MAG: YidC/Oxa1 family membrane protein insertase [Clostridia bacterium]|nr:YidC/Oxa1 family membrane protein insertase [Clostridia bacterium]